MALSFNKAAIIQSVSGLVGTIIRYGLISAAISLALVMVTWGAVHVQSLTGNQPTFETQPNMFPEVPQVNMSMPVPQNASFMGIMLNVNPIQYLSQYPMFRYMNYVQYLWYLLLFPVFLGGSLFIIILSQGNGMAEQQVVDYYAQVAWDTIWKTGAALIMWILVGGAILIGFMAYPSDFMQTGLGGLQILGAGSFWSAVMKVITVIFPYVPIVIEVSAHVYLLKEIHAGWVGNRW